jgi:hypothetical protein
VTYKDVCFGLVAGFIGRLQYLIMIYSGAFTSSHNCSLQTIAITHSLSVFLTVDSSHSYSLQTIAITHSLSVFLTVDSSHSYSQNAIAMRH